MTVFENYVRAHFSVQRRVIERGSRFGRHEAHIFAQVWARLRFTR